MGDVVGLVETAMEKINQEEAQKSAMRMMEGKFDLNDLLSQIRQINNMGDVKGIMKMIPGLSKFRDKIDAANVDNKVIKHQEAIILSMTPYERKHPDVLKAARKQRIANGAGVSVMDVNRLLKQYEQMATVMKQFKKMGPMGMFKMMKQMKGMMGGNMPDLGALGGMGGLGGGNPFAGLGSNPFGGSMPDMNSPELQELMKKFPKM
jgi:signal recognition particle subunit SRP54